MLRHQAKGIGLSILSGLLAGGAATLFLVGLEWVTTIRTAHLGIIWLLPIAGFGIGWAFHHYGKSVAGGSALIIDEINEPKKIVPIHMAPFVLVGTWITHLFGGSAGREGTSVQMGASLSDQLSKRWNLSPEERKRLLMAGAGAGFGAAIGTPLAGAIFGIEVVYKRKVSLMALCQCLIASFVATYFTRFLGAPHTVYPQFECPNLTLNSLVYVGLAGVVFGLVARFFIKGVHVIEGGLKRLIAYPPFRPVLGGTLVVIGFYVEKSYRYAGLGLTVIQEAFHVPAHIDEPLYKALFTAMTVGSGFKGGEFIPLVFIGTTLGSALSEILPVSFQVLAVSGFAAVFGAASKTPLACSVMAIELFGLEVGPYVALACYVAYYFAGKHSIYKKGH